MPPYDPAGYLIACLHPRDSLAIIHRSCFEMSRRSWPLWRASNFPPQVGMVSLIMVPWRCWTFRSSGSASPYVVRRPDPD